MAPRPDISIALIAYNHEKFIKDTFHGIAMQEFSGTIEVIIGDDCSLDRTRELATEFAAQHPNVKLLFHAKNGGMVHNWTTTIDACTGRYIALCEGDDYWTDPCKLQRQFDLMEQHPEHSMCWHPVDVMEEGVQLPYPYAEGKEIADINDIIQSHFIPTCSLVFRNGLVHWPHWIKEVKAMDLILESMLATYGTAVRIDMNMGTYRQHPAGISKMDINKSSVLFSLSTLKKFNNWSNRNFDEVVRQKIVETTRFHLKRNDLKSLRYLILRLQLFAYHLYGRQPKSFREVRNEMYVHLIPEIYRKYVSF